MTWLSMANRQWLYIACYTELVTVLCMSMLTKWARWTKHENISAEDGLHYAPCMPVRYSRTSNACPLNPRPSNSYFT
jgi:hypothetical protein